jgi:hypothetical protein
VTLPNLLLIGTVDHTCNHIRTVLSQSPMAGTRGSFGTAVSVKIGTPPPRRTYASDHPKDRRKPASVLPWLAPTMH